MTAWPASLPQSPLFDGLSYSPQDQSVSTTMQVGPPKRRRRYSSEVGNIAPLRFIITGVQLATFRTFWGTTMAGGSLTFTHTDPNDDSTATYQFTGAPSWSLLKPHNDDEQRKWLLTVPVVIVG